MNPKWDPKLYSEKHAFVFHYGQSLIDLLAPKPKERILDLGCGSGQLTANIREVTKYVIGMDLSLDMIKEAKENYPFIPFVLGDGADFLFDEPFDAIFSNATLHWITQYREVIECMYDNLKEGGRIVLEFGGKGNVRSIIDQLRDSLKSRGYTMQAAKQVWYFPTISEYTMALEAAGFQVSFAQNYSSPTELADASTGIKDWISMFGQDFFIEVSDEDIEAIKMEVQKKLKKKLFRNGKWYADYKRIRIKAEKEAR